VDWARGLELALRMAELTAKDLGNVAILGKSNIF